MHLLIPFAASLSEACRHAAENLQLPHLQALLNSLEPLPLVTLGESSLSPPHERALADVVWGPGQDGLLPDLRDGLLPWAAQQAAQAGLAGPADAAWALITPCRWSVQSQHITMDDPAALQLSASESKALLAAMLPYFAEDGIALHYQTPTCWLAQGTAFAGLPTASLDRVLAGGSDGGSGHGRGRDIQSWIPKAAAAKNLRRLQQEMQMLLYTHPLSDDRAARGLPAVNSFWVSGTGSLASPGATPTNIVQPLDLRQAALRDDGAAWQAAWHALDASPCAALLQAVGRGEAARLTLCGERAYQSFHVNGDGKKAHGAPAVRKTGLDRLFYRLKRKMRPVFPSQIFNSL